MKKNTDKYEGKDGKKFLKAQTRALTDDIGDVLRKYNDANHSEKNPINPKPKTENDYIREILEGGADLFAKRAIVGDIWSYSKKIGGEEKQVIKFKCKYGLGITVDNLNSFLDFCAIHGFIPMVDKIFIESHDISQVKQLYNFFSFVITKPGNPLIMFALGNEIKKLEDSVQDSAKEILLYLQQITGYATSTYKYLLGDKLQKLKNIGTLSENIFAEIAIRLENQIREKIGIESSYLKLAGYEDDSKKKTDMDFVIKKTPQQSYQSIPMQFTTSSTKGEQLKELDIESYLIKSINSGTVQPSFLLFSVNGEFSKNITHGDKKNKKLLNEEYRDWLNNPKEREKNVGSKFPLFIDSIDSEIIQPAEVMYIALHMLYKKYNFRYSTKESYINSFKKIGKIDRTNRGEIYNRIKISDILVDECSVEEIINPRPNHPGILKHRFVISYQGESVGVIVVYEIAK